MIFLSYSHMDKEVIEPSACVLRRRYGQENVFFDIWSIQPGDNIPKKLSEGLSNSNYFFLFYSSSAKESVWVEQEWTSAHYNALQSGCDAKLVVVKIDGVELPCLLKQYCYIDWHNAGKEGAIRQIIDVIDGRNTYRESDNSHYHITANIENKGKKVIITCEAEYLEPHASFLIVVENSKEDLKYRILHEVQFTSAFLGDIAPQDGNNKQCKRNCISIGTQRQMTPGFPCVIELEQTGNKPIVIYSIMHEKSRGTFKSIKVKDKVS